MQKAINRRLKAQRGLYNTPTRREWIFSNPCQIVSCVSQMVWAVRTEEALVGSGSGGSGSAGRGGESPVNLSTFYTHIVEQLQDLTVLVRENLSTLERRSVAALAIQDLHNRDIVAELLSSGVDTLDSFTWVQQLRHYWSEEGDECTIAQVDSIFSYGNEYLGAPTRLVITPLTDRCWLTITNCLKLLKLSGSVAGPAGAGKTESVKELARMLGYFCLVFNCSETVDLYVLEKVFAGIQRKQRGRKKYIY
ncbi:atpase family associated with various cellular activities domain-containing protein, partial [Cystoisospora suis]